MFEVLLQHSVLHIVGVGKLFTHLGAVYAIVDYEEELPSHFPSYPKRSVLLQTA